MTVLLKIEKVTEVVEFLNIFILVLIGIALLISVLCVLTVPHGVISLPLGIFTLGIFELLASRVFHFLADVEIYRLADVDRQFWIHILTFLFLFSFILGGKRLQQMALKRSFFSSVTNYQIYMVFSVVLVVGIFFAATPLEPILSSILVGSFIDKWGIHHIVAMALAAVAVFYIFQLELDWSKILSVSVAPIIAFLFLISIQHLWEALHESLHLINSSEEMGEGVEGAILVGALGFLIYGMWRLLRHLETRQE